MTKRLSFVVFLLLLFPSANFFEERPSLKKHRSRLSSKAKFFKEKRQFERLWRERRRKQLPLLKSMSLHWGSPPAKEWASEITPPFALSQDKSQAHHHMDILMLVHDEKKHFHIIVQQSLLELPSRNLIREISEDYRIPKKKPH